MIHFSIKKLSLFLSCWNIKRAHRLYKFKQPHSCKNRKYVSMHCIISYSVAICKKIKTTFTQHVLINNWKSTININFCVTHDFRFVVFGVWKSSNNNRKHWIIKHAILQHILILWCHNYILFLLYSFIIFCLLITNNFIDMFVRQL